MLVNWKGRIAILDLGRRARGDFQPIDVKSTSPVDLIPSPCVVFDLAPFSWPGEGGTLLWGTRPTSPVKGFALATLSWLSLIRLPRLSRDPYWCDITTLRTRHP